MQQNADLRQFSSEIQPPLPAYYVGQMHELPSEQMTTLVTRIPGHLTPYWSE